MPKRNGNGAPENFLAELVANVIDLRADFKEQGQAIGRQGEAIGRHGEALERQGEAIESMSEALERMSEAVDDQRVATERLSEATGQLLVHVRRSDQTLAKMAKTLSAASNVLDDR